MGRPKKKNSNPEYAMLELMKRAMTLYQEPFDDRVDRKSTLPSVRFVSEQMNTSLLRTRKLLISAGYYSTSISRRVSSLFGSGKSIEEIMKETGLGRASVYSYIPYFGLAFNLDETTVNADRHKLFRRRKKAVLELNKHVGTEFEEEYLWNAIREFEDYPFKTAKGLGYRYKIKVGKDGSQNEELIFDRKTKSITKATILLAYRKALDIQRSEGRVTGPKKLGVFGASYLYPMFLRFGIITAVRSSDDD